MKTLLLGAASLIAFGLTACAKTDETTASTITTADATEPSADTPTEIAVEAADTAPVAVETTDMLAVQDPVVQLTNVTTVAGVSAAADSLFAAADADNDGMLTPGEFSVLTALLVPVDDVIETAEITPDAPVVDSADAMVGDASSVANALDFQVVAGDGGSVSASDLRSALLARFETADANKDGALDAVEQTEFARLLALE